MSSKTFSGRAVLVLGMHRSGTSSLTGSLEECGLSLGPVNRVSPHNLKGNLENPGVMDLHMELLRHNGGSWSRPPERVTWTTEHQRRWESLIGEYRGEPIFGIKDPRTLLLMDFWRASGLELSFVGSFRHPLAVAESLRTRDSFPQDRALDLWTHYNRLLIRWCEELAFDLVSFDLPRPDYTAAVAEAGRGLGLSVPEAGLTYFESRLRRHRSSSEPLPEEIEDLYQKLQELEARPGLSRGFTRSGH